eukprot:734572-Rhodomonas_salina.2
MPISGFASVERECERRHRARIKRMRALVFCLSPRVVFLRPVTIDLGLCLSLHALSLARSLFSLSSLAPSSLLLCSTSSASSSPRSLTRSRKRMSIRSYCASTALLNSSPDAPHTRAQYRSIRELSTARQRLHTRAQYRQTHRCWRAACRSARRTT